MYVYIIYQKNISSKFLLLIFNFYWYKGYYWNQFTSDKKW